VTATIPRMSLMPSTRRSKTATREGMLPSLSTWGRRARARCRSQCPPSTAAALRETGGVALCIETDFASLTFESAALQATAGEDGDLLFPHITAGYRCTRRRGGVADRRPARLQLLRLTERHGDFDFGGGSVQISIPYTPAAERPQRDRGVLY
jgi:hypothetical protein